jgi:hypothetical protein
MHEQIGHSNQEMTQAEQRNVPGDGGFAQMLVMQFFKVSHRSRIRKYRA